MKKNKLLAAMCAAALAIGTFAVPTYAEAGDGCVDFEDGNFSFVTMKTEGEADADASELSVVDFNGSKALSVKIVDATLTPKVWFHAEQIWAPSDLAKIKRVTIDCTVASQDGTTAPGWNGGAIGTDGLDAAGEAAPAWAQSDYTGPEEYTNPVSTTATLERKFLLPTQMWTEDTVTAQLLLMRWSNTVPAILYLDNITAYDADGNIIPATYPSGASADAPAAAPAGDGATTAASTGNTPAIIMATVMLLAGGTAIISRRRNRK
ncbi:MAG: hypothetical protein LBL80_03195 [Ruminococcus sp.]|jgi:hypothetical protein|nr:hypothetical protein [Ruminococcus sp.]